jgi:hypothetical protein
MVVYDTGSDWLTVKACFTNQHCNMKIDKEKTIKKYGADSASALLDDDDLQIESLIRTMNDDDEE